MTVNSKVDHVWQFLTIIITSAISDICYWRIYLQVAAAVVDLNVSLWHQFFFDEFEWFVNNLNLYIRQNEDQNASCA